VAAREAILDRLLTGQKPIERGVQLILIGACDCELIRERGQGERPRGRQLRRRRDHTLADHRQHQVALP